jgi:hypothetical protein
LKILILHPSLSAKVFPYWELEHIINISMKHLVQTLKQRHSKGSEIIPTEFLSLTDDSALGNWIAQVLVSPPLEEPERAAHDCLIRLKCREKESQISELLNQLKSAQAKKEDPTSYSIQIIRLKKEIEHLKHQKLWDFHS